MKPITLIGTGLAGYTLAREFRKLDAERPLVLITADDGAFYSKPMLSNALAQGRDPDTLVSADAEKMAADLNATVLTHARVERIDRARRVVVHARGEQAYGTLVLATGARPIRPPLQGDAADEALTVNNLDDYRRFRRRLDDKRKIAIIGPGLIGCEFANDLLETGHACDLIGPDAWPVSTLLPQPLGERLQAALAERGARWHLQDSVIAIDHADPGYRLRLQQGAPIEAELVLSAIGLRPDTRLAEAAGLSVRRGIVTDRLLRTSDPDIHALGDCAEAAGLVLPFVMPIMHAARALAKTLAGEPTEVHYPAMPVVIKTPACPLAVAPPPRDAGGEWRYESDDQGIAARHVGKDGKLLGFALCGDRVKQRMALTRELPPLL